MSIRQVFRARSDLYNDLMKWVLPHCPARLRYFALVAAAAINRAWSQSTVASMHEAFLALGLQIVVRAKSASVPGYVTQ